MDQATFQLVRSAPLFSSLTDEQIVCIEAGEVIDVPAGTVLVAEGEPSGSFFFVVIEGEVRLTRNYDRQTVLMGTIKPGHYTGETTLLLGIPWLATARVARPTRLFRLGEDDFWRMVSTCRSVAREIFHSAANKMRNIEGYSQQREKLASLGTMAAGLAHELNNPAAAASPPRGRASPGDDGQGAIRSCVSSPKPSGMTIGCSSLAAAWIASERLVSPVLDHLERSDRAEVITNWLEARGVPNAWELAPTFVSAGCGLRPGRGSELLAKLPVTSHAKLRRAGWRRA